LELVTDKQDQVLNLSLVTILAHCEHSIDISCPHSTLLHSLPVCFLKLRNDDDLSKIV